MNIKTLGKYLEHCQKTGQKDSWEGLIKYAEEVK